MRKLAVAPKLVLYTCDSRYVVAERFEAGLLENFSVASTTRRLED